MARLDARQKERDATQTDLQLAAATYEPLPEGYRRARTAELQELDLHDGTTSLTRMADGDFQAEVFVHRDAAGQDACKIALCGTQTGADWQQNAAQGLGRPSAHYAQAAEIAHNAEAVPPGRQLYRAFILGIRWGAGWPRSPPG